ncbi:MAG: phytoene desaturase family protein [Spirochaetota bacterium]
MSTARGAARGPARGRVAVVGAGLGGLSAAISLAAAGREVDVYERGAGPGGKAGTQSLAGYRFDTGPSLLTMPWVFERLFAQAGATFSERVDLRPLSTVCRYFWSDGPRFDAPGSPEGFIARAAETFGEPEANLQRFFDRARRIYEITGHLFLEKSLHEWKTMFSKGFFRSLVQVGRIDSKRSLHAANAATFDDPRLVQLFDRYATYNGSSPFLTPATMAIIADVEYRGGAYALGGGIYSLPRALEELAREIGVRFSYETPVERILTNPATRRVAGIEAAGEKLDYEVVVSNVDVSVTYPELLGDEKARAYRRYRALEPSSSGFVFYWGMSRTFREIDLHNIFFSDDYREEFAEIFSRREIPRDPTVYVNVTSKVTEGDAPEGGENWFVLLNVPPDRGQDWNALGDRLREAVLRRLSRRLGTNVEEAVAVEDRMSPHDIQQRTASPGGSLYGIASNSSFAAFRRHPNRSRRYPGLYFCGGSAHPGGGMPLAVLSGRIVGHLLDEGPHIAR